MDPLDVIAQRWARPSVVSDLLLAFPARVMRLMPSEDECRAGLAALPDGGREWLELQRRWFVHGPAEVKFHMVEGVDGNTAFRHLQALQSSYEPKHEHKEVAVAYLASLWFVDIEYGPSP